ncbi:MAG: maltotransferase domain-containing protein [Candidatus Dormibacteria bacterium]
MSGASWQSSFVANRLEPALPSPAPGGIAISDVTPVVACGRFPAKAVLEQLVPVRANVFTDGHQALLVRAAWRSRGRPSWHHAWLEPHIDDLWVGAMSFSALGAAEFRIEAWPDRFHSWQTDYRRWLRAKVDATAELPAGRALLGELLPLLPATTRTQLERRIARLEGASPEGWRRFLLSPRLASRLAAAVARTPATRSATFPVYVERERALVGAWYEFFPRSEGASEARSGTFATAAQRLTAISQMGFDVVYLPPIHPIGRTARRGPNNSPVAGPDDPGSPWAIGGPEGGHTSVHPQLGTLDDFANFQATARGLGLEVALDYTLQCSPDHPWVREHPEWFMHRPDGSIRTAENPPKRYDDVLPFDFECPDWRQLWEACYQILEFWISHGVRIFRVDNPHTKPLPFWAWLIGRLRREHPEVVMLAEAFTRPALMDELSKLGFSQSYTYFTWRSTKAELRSYLTRLTRTSVDYLRPNFFVNTPDILTRELQQGGPAAFRSRLLLAATLSPSYGIYSGFELCENQPHGPQTEEYLNSEKYQYRPRDWGAPNSLAPLITRLNDIRRQHPALRQLHRLHFHLTDDPKVLAYSKHTEGHSDVVLVLVNLDPTRVRSARLSLAMSRLGLRPRARFRVQGLLSPTGPEETWEGRLREVRLDPARGPGQVLWIRPWR